MQDRMEIMGPNSNVPMSHYTDAVRFGDLLFVSGVAAVDRESRIVGPGDVVRQAKQVFENMGDILKAAGASPSDVLKVTVYLTDVKDHDAINPIRKEFFGDARPASTLIGVRSLIVPGLLIEVDAVFGMKKR